MDSRQCGKVESHERHVWTMEYPNASIGQDPPTRDVQCHGVPFKPPAGGSGVSRPGRVDIASAHVMLAGKLTVDGHERWHRPSGSVNAEMIVNVERDGLIHVSPAVFIALARDAGWKPGRSS